MATGTAGRQRIRYKILKEIGVSDGDRILDVGCGTGNFLSYLDRSFRDIHYTGIDIVPEFVGHCRKKFPPHKFYHTDLLNFKPSGRFDYVIASQSFNNRFKNLSNYAYVRKVLRRAYELADKGVAMDFVTHFVDFKERHLFYYDPTVIFTEAKKITKRVTLRHDYPLYEFCVYLYKDFEGWRKK